jgi:hypothetical protein
MSIEDDCIALMATAKRQQAAIDTAVAELGRTTKALSDVLRQVKDTPETATEALKTAVAGAAGKGVSDAFTEGQKRLGVALTALETRAGELAEIGEQSIWVTLAIAAAGAMVGGFMSCALVIYRLDSGEFRPNAKAIAAQILESAPPNAILKKKR